MLIEISRKFYGMKVLSLNQLVARRAAMAAMIVARLWVRVSLPVPSSFAQNT